MDILRLHNPNPHHINEARLTLHDARYHLENPEARYYTPPELSQTALQGSPPHPGILEAVDPMREQDILGSNSEILEAGNVLSPDNPSKSVLDSEGRLNPSLDFQYAQQFRGRRSDTEMNEGDGDGDPAQGGGSRSRKRSVSKRTRRKGVAKKQKSKKNKRQSRRKVRRASSRKSRK
jgi:hypothetical protein